jgi:hypothetical protein
VVNSTPRPLYPRERCPVPTVQEGGGWAPGTIWTGTENLYPTGIRSPARPARSELLYRKSYPSPPGLIYTYIYVTIQFVVALLAEVTKQHISTSPSGCTVFCMGRCPPYTVVMNTALLFWNCCVSASANLRVFASSYY